MVERTSYGETVVAVQVCAQCGKTGEMMITVHRYASQMTGSKFIACYCSHECQMRSKGLNVFDGELEALLEARLRRLQ
jgi:hypothetical protein